MDQPEEKLAQRYAREQRARLWMYLGVGAVAVMIIFIWGYALKARLDNFSWNKSEEKELTQTAKKTWDELFADTAVAETAKKQLLQIINKINAEATTTGDAALETPTTAVR